MRATCGDIVYILFRHVYMQMMQSVFEETTHWAHDVYTTSH